MSSLMAANLFYDILNKAYLWKNKCTESEMLEMLNLERSRYYDKMMVYK